jgi:hypothetical protein
LPRDRQLVLLGQQLRLRREHAVEIDQPTLVLGLHQFHGVLGLLDALLQALCLELILKEGHQGVLDLAAGRQHRLLILQDLLLQAGVLEADVVEDAAVQSALKAATIVPT